MIFQTCSKTIIICHYDNDLNVNPTSFHFPDILYSPVLSPKSLQLVSRASNEQNSGFYMKFFLHFFSSPQFYFISFGEISGTFRKVAICNNHCPIQQLPEQPQFPHFAHSVLPEQQSFFPICEEQDLLHSRGYNL